MSALRPRVLRYLMKRGFKRRGDLRRLLHPAKLCFASLRITRPYPSKNFPSLEYRIAGCYPSYSFEISALRNPLLLGFYIVYIRPIPRVLTLWLLNWPYSNIVCASPFRLPGKCFSCLHLRFQVLLSREHSCRRLYRRISK